MKGNFIILDCETGGLDFTQNPITQIALLGVDLNGKEIGRFETYIKPYENLVITDTAAQSSLLDRNKLSNGLTNKEAVKLIIEFCKKVAGKMSKFNLPVLVGHNIPFDIGFVQALFFFAGKDMAEYFSNSNGVFHHVDTQQLSKRAWPEESSLKLGICCERAGIQLADAHGAMNDVVATKKLFDFFFQRNANFKSRPVEVEEIEQQRSRKHFKF